MSATPPRLSIVLPCLNGAAYIADSLRRLHTWLEHEGAALGPTEVVLVDDGSRDGTMAAARATGLPFHFVRHEQNRGKGAAVRSGMRQACGEFRIFMDADMPFELDVLLRISHYLDFKEFDVCIGTRAARGTAYSVGSSKLRRIMSRLFAELVGRLVVTGVRDTQCGIKAFRAPVADYLFRESRVDGFAFDVEVLYLAFKNGFDVKSIPVILAQQQPSTIGVLWPGVPMLLDVLRLPFRYYRGTYRLYYPAP